MNFLEKNLEDIISDTPNYLLNQRGLQILGKKKRQIRIGNYGISDLITAERKSWHALELTVYELKKDKIDIQTFLQALDYVKGISVYLNKRQLLSPYHLRMVLIGKEIDHSNSFCYMPDFVDMLEIYTYEYRFDGIFFTQHNAFKLTNDGFDSVKSRLKRIVIPETNTL